MSNCKLAVFAALLASAASFAAAPPPMRGDPLKGVVLGGEVVYCARYAAIAVKVYLHPLRKDQPTPGRWCSYSDGVPVRWQLGQGAFWVSHQMRAGVPSHSPTLEDGGLLRFDQRLLSVEGVKLIGHEGTNFSGNLPADLSAFHAFDPRYFLHCDTLPAGKAKARHFTATNLTSGFDARNKEFEEGKTPASKFYCHLGESRRDKDGEWEEHSWKHEWTTPATFKEPFQALALGDDFYFVTSSGSLFRAAKPAKGTDRVLTRVWDGKRPIKAFVSDAGTGKTFLFVPPAKDGGKRAFFELSDKPRLVEYDPKLVPMPPLEEPHRTIVHAARILVALKKIKGDASPKVGGKE